MAQLWTLQLTDFIDTLDFMGGVSASLPAGVTMHVQNGGFDISLPQAKRELAQVRPGFYVPQTTYFEYRQAKLKFSIFEDIAVPSAPVRSNGIIKGLQVIERITRRIAAQSRLTAGKRGQLTYAWEGATNLSYFEVYGADISLTSDLLSVEKIHMMIDDHFVLPDIELTLYVSATGYGIALSSDTLTEVPIKKNGGSYVTGGVTIKNPSAENDNWVEVSGTASQIDGGQPFLTRIQIAPGASYKAWSSLFIGHRVTPFPTDLIHDSSEADTIAVSFGGTLTSNANALGGNYLAASINPSTPSFPTSPVWGWSVGAASSGMFMVFMHGFNPLPPTGPQFAVGIKDTTKFGIVMQEDFVIPQSQFSLPLGAVMLPPSGPDLLNMGTLDPALQLSIFGAFDATGGSYNYDLDFVSLLPIDNGLRIWKVKSEAVTATLIDDGWRGLAYAKDGSSNVWTPFYTLLAPIMLEPNVTQRLYFHPVGQSSGANAPSDSLADRNRDFSVRLYVVPTFLTMAV